MTVGPKMQILKTQSAKGAFSSAVVLSITGVISIVLSVYVLQKNAIPGTWQKEPGNVVSVEKVEAGRGVAYNYKIQYEASGQQYYVSGQDSIFTAAGQQKNIAYNPSNPTQTKVIGSNFYEYLLLVIGIVIFLLGLASYRNYLRQKKKSS